VLRDGLALVIGWIGMMKSTGYEAKCIEPLVAHSPLLSWMYGLWTIRQYAALGAAIWSLGEALIPKEKPTIEP
jgi:reactive chlorine resistance protein C